MSGGGSKGGGAVLPPGYPCQLRGRQLPCRGGESERQRLQDSDGDRRAGRVQHEQGLLPGPEALWRRRHHQHQRHAALWCNLVPGARLCRQGGHRQPHPHAWPGVGDLWDQGRRRGPGPHRGHRGHGQAGAFRGRRHQVLRTDPGGVHGREVGHRHGVRLPVQHRRKVCERRDNGGGRSCMDVEATNRPARGHCRPVPESGVHQPRCGAGRRLTTRRQEQAVGLSTFT
mmetsp:Transcript_27681/g.71228  ORF Transcript_27681/g.71228 Transcript_27681/m.71228 type:complete len:228 (-) Transcript_27681:148-831(-)